ncbi:hypothetical protein M441DRAFT_68035 [Trichoderma asperellum CBS 433.97]|uniref:Uncharacterized protein n=1 Tax=Trichoderma asperellum (strain ATCC 204424 / CBS 433.97 / NBRC 101777) TaxID=1042311 RepID=A0A2T3ZCI0_TRIA4|nr:hypothetical protein M441DRAFT_68035 [Trichoderma asperellum CBS 433.97]PTB42512.1 hypothetical protein M441DRAFT_68035 [Trichoderma asperellum CBS 433.97]
MDLWTNTPWKHYDPDDMNSVEELVQGTKDWLTADQDTRTRVAAILPNLIKGFASRLRYDTEYLIHQDIITFIDDHSYEISAECLSALSTEPNIIQGIQDTIMSSLLPAHHYGEPQNCAVVFELECDLRSFSETQNPEDRPGEGLKAAFTMTGSDLDVQGATCGNYMHQTWPLTGKAITELVRGALCTMPDGTKLSASIDESTGKLTVEAYGSAVSVAELGEQLAWLRPAVRASPLDNDKIAYCVPVIIKDLGSGNMMPHSSIFQPSFEKMEETSGTRLNGRCIIVKGYPISRRNVWRESGCPGQCDVMIGTDYWNRLIEKLCCSRWCL